MFLFRFLKFWFFLNYHFEISSDLYSFLKLRLLILLTVLFSSFFFFNHVNRIVGLLDLGFSKLKSMIPTRSSLLKI